MVRAWLRRLRTRLFGTRSARRPIVSRDHSARLGVESLEERTLMATGLVASLTDDGLLHIYGTPGKDTIAVQRNGDQIAVVGSSIRYDGAIDNTVDAADVTRIEISALKGDDTITLGQANQPLGVETVILGTAGTKAISTDGTVVSLVADARTTAVEADGRTVLELAREKIPLGQNKYSYQNNLYAGQAGAPLTLLAKSVQSYVLGPDHATVYALTKAGILYRFPNADPATVQQVDDADQAFGFDSSGSLVVLGNDWNVYRWDGAKLSPVADPTRYAVVRNGVLADLGEMGLPVTPGWQTKPAAGFDPATFRTQYQYYFGPTTKAVQNNLLDLLTRIQNDPTVTDLRDAAYMLATAKAETGIYSSARPEGPGNDKPKGQSLYDYFEGKYGYLTPKGEELGNTQEGDGYDYRGRGYVQITGRANYARFSTPGHDLIANPDDVRNADVAYSIMSRGMLSMGFPKKVLGDYIKPNGPADLYNARRIINGTDRADEIADYARRFLFVLMGSRATPPASAAKTLSVSRALLSPPSAPAASPQGKLTPAMNWVPLTDSDESQDDPDAIPDPYGTYLDDVAASMAADALADANAAPGLAALGLNQALPFVRQRLADVLGPSVTSAWSDALGFGLDPTADLETILAQLQASGFTVDTLSTLPDGHGNLIQVERDADFAPGLTFDVGGQTGFDYLDHNLTGALSGHLTGSAKGHLHLVLGIDLDPTTQQLRTYIDDSSTITITADVSGTVTGTLSLASLGSVDASGTATLHASATLGFKSLHADHKLRVDDFLNHLGDAVTGDVSGTLDFSNVTLTTHVASFTNNTFQANFSESFHNGQVTVTRQDVNLPNPQQLLGDLVQALQSGTASVRDASGALAKQALGLHIPLLQQSLSEALDVPSALQDVFNLNIGSAAGWDDLAAKLRAAGFHIDVLAGGAANGGDVLRVSKDFAWNGSGVRFDIGGKTDFDYFDNAVNGALQGALRAQGPSFTMHVVLGIDMQNGKPSFYLADATALQMTGLTAHGSASGDMSIRNLADVHVDGQLDASLGGSITLANLHGDHKVRLADITSLAAVTGGVSGHVDLHDVNLTARLPVLGNIGWTGHWQADISSSGITAHADLTKPDAGNLLLQLGKGLFSAAGGFNPLGTIGGLLTQKLPVIGDITGETLADELGISSSLGWLTKVINVASMDLATLRKTLSDLGITGDLLNDPVGSVTKLINGDKVDLLHYQLDGRTEWSKRLSTILGVIPLPPPVSFITVDVKAFIEPYAFFRYHVGLGIDTTGFYLDQNTGIGVGGGVRAGLEGDISVLGFLDLASLEFGAGFSVAANIGLNDPDPTDGKIYLDELFRPGQSLSQDFLSAFHISLSGELNGFAKAVLSLPWPLPDITLMDRQFSLGKIWDVNLLSTMNSPKDSNRIRALGSSAAKPLTLPILPDGTLVIQGDSDVANSVYVSGGNGAVDVTWFGHGTGHFTGVKKILFTGGNKDDRFQATPDFNIPVEAHGGAGNDTLIGGSANDTLYGDAGDDSLVGGDGNDVLYGGNPTLLSGSGNDTLEGGTGNDYLNGGDGNDSLSGGADNDTLIVSGPGNSSLDGGSGNDLLVAGDGTDILHGGTGDDTLIGGSGPYQQLYGDAGNDWLYAGTGANQVLDGGDDNDHLYAGEGPGQQLFGGAGNDWLQVGWHRDAAGNPQGDDPRLGGSGKYGYEMHGGDGNDMLFGGGGNDSLFGDAGDDEMHGGEGDDYLSGGDGNDLLFGDGGSDTLDGGAGNNLVLGDYGTDPSVGNALAGAHMTPDPVPASGRPGNDTIIVGPGLNKMYGEQGDDTFLIDFAYGNSASADTISGGPGRDAIVLEGGDKDSSGAPLNDDMTVSLVNAHTSTYAVSDKYVTWNYDASGNIVSVKQILKYLGSVQYSMPADVEDFRVNGQAGDDRIRVDPAFTQRIQVYGGDGNDLLIAGGGDATLMGGAGNDVLVAGPGHVVLHGGSGSADPSVDAGNDILIGGGGSDVLLGEGGAMDADVLIGGGGASFLYGGWGNNVIFGDHYHDLAGVLPGGAAGYTLSPAMLAALQSAKSVASQTRPDAKGRPVAFDAVNTDGTSGVVIFGHPDTSSAQGGGDVVLGSAGDDVILGGGGNNYIDGRAGMDVILGGAGTKTLGGATTAADILIGGGGFDRIIAGSKDSYLYATEPGDPATSLERVALGGGPSALQHIRTAEQREINQLAQQDTDLVNEEIDRAALNAFFSLAGLVPQDPKKYPDPATAAQLIADCQQSTTLTGKLRYPDPADPTGTRPLSTQALFAKLEALYGSDPAANYTRWHDLLPEDHKALTNLQHVVQQADNTVRDEYQQFGSGVSSTDLDLANSPFYVLLGGDGNDTIYGSADEDVINGGGGNNNINWSPGADVIFGGSDKTKVNAFVVSGTSSDDTITIDSVSRTENTVRVQFVDPVTGRQIDTGTIRTDFLGINTVGVKALGGNDRVVFTDEAKLDSSLNYVLDGGAGDDVLDASGTQSDVTLIGGTGNDRLTAGMGADVLIGSDARQLGDGSWAPVAVDGPDGDTLIAGSGIGQKLYGGSGNDTLIGFVGANPGQGANAVLDGGDGNDTVLAASGSGQILKGGAGVNTIVLGNAPSPTVDGTGGTSTLVYRAASGDNVVVFDRAFDVNGTFKTFTPINLAATKVEYTGTNITARAATISDVATWVSQGHYEDHGNYSGSVSTLTSFDFHHSAQGGNHDWTDTISWPQNAVGIWIHYWWQWNNHVDSATVWVSNWTSNSVQVHTHGNGMGSGGFLGWFSTTGDIHVWGNVTGYVWIPKMVWVDTSHWVYGPLSTQYGLSTRLVITNQPTLTGVPANVVVPATSAAGAVVTYTMPTAHDGSKTDPAVTASTPSGAVFPIGTTVVTFTTKGANGVVTTSSFTVTVLPPTDPPVAADDTYSTAANKALTVAAPGILANDSVKNGKPLQAVLVSSTAHGKLTLNADGSFVYTPDKDYSGADSFTYVATDGTFRSTVATVKLTVA